MPWSPPGTGWRPRKSGSIADGKGICALRKIICGGRRKKAGLKQQCVSTSATWSSDKYLSNIFIRLPALLAFCHAQGSADLILVDDISLPGPGSPLRMDQRFCGTQSIFDFPH
ncbi:hypothetical protein GJV26_07295 [Massilia dura]|uniref:Uncharacterized protein n=1 Tax=Pseudoduganella dura TaxID=321982 RepID=A0A6I3XGA5_9BURK|nr:hypothetical protein [Pseudoduganella dura]MUI12282.1 hypothetical protein [Pseudoduganella dura]